jgi:hypothetical protein
LAWLPLVILLVLGVVAIQSRPTTRSDLSPAHGIRAADAAYCAGRIACSGPAGANAGKFAVAQPERQGYGAPGIGHLDSPILPFVGRGRMLLPELLDGLEGLVAGRREIGNLDPGPVGNDVMPVHEMEVLALHDGDLRFGDLGFPLSGRPSHPSVQPIDQGYIPRGEHRAPSRAEPWSGPVRFRPRRDLQTAPERAEAFGVHPGNRKQRGR